MGIPFPCTSLVAGVAENTWWSTLNFEDRILVDFFNSKVTLLKIIKFPYKGSTANGLNYLLKKLRDTGTTAWQPGS